MSGENAKPCREYSKEGQGGQAAACGGWEAVRGGGSTLFCVTLGYNDSHGWNFRQQIQLNVRKTFLLDLSKGEHGGERQ